MCCVDEYTFPIVAKYCISSCYSIHHINCLKPDRFCYFCMNISHYYVTLVAEATHLPHTLTISYIVFLRA